MSSPVGPSNKAISTSPFYPIPSQDPAVEEICEFLNQENCEGVTSKISALIFEDPSLHRESIRQGIEALLTKADFRLTLGELPKAAQGCKGALELLDLLQPDHIAWESLHPYAQRLLREIERHPQGYPFVSWICDPQQSLNALPRFPLPTLDQIRAVLTQYLSPQELSRFAARLSIASQLKRGPLAQLPLEARRPLALAYEQVLEASSRAPLFPEEPLYHWILDKLFRLSKAEETTLVNQWYDCLFQPKSLHSCLQAVYAVCVLKAPLFTSSAPAPGKSAPPPPRPFPEIDRKELPPKKGATFEELEKALEHLRIGINKIHPSLSQRLVFSAEGIDSFSAEGLCLSIEQYLEAGDLKEANPLLDYFEEILEKLEDLLEKEEFLPFAPPYLPSLEQLSERLFKLKEKRIQVLLNRKVISIKKLITQKKIAEAKKEFEKLLEIAERYPERNRFYPFFQRGIEEVLDTLPPLTSFSLALQRGCDCFYEQAHRQGVLWRDRAIRALERQRKEEPEKAKKSLQSKIEAIFAEKVDRLLPPFLEMVGTMVPLFDPQRHFLLLLDLASRLVDRGMPQAGVWVEQTGVAFALLSEDRRIEQTFRDVVEALTKAVGPEPADCPA